MKENELLVALLGRQMHFISIQQRSLLAFPYKSYFVPRIIFRGCISRCSPKSCNLSGESKSRDTYPFDEVLERETSFAYTCYTGAEEREGREQDGVEDTRFTVNLSFSDYESFPLYLDPFPWKR